MITSILEGLRTSNVADALNEKVVKGPDNVVEFTMERLLESIDWHIFFILSKGVVPTAKRGNSSENAVYLLISKP